MKSQILQVIGVLVWLCSLLLLGTRIYNKSIGQTAIKIWLAVLPGVALAAVFFGWLDSGIQDLTIFSIPRPPFASLQAQACPQALPVPRRAI